jgi:hypothetical protein
MKIYRVDLEGTSPYSPSRYHETPKLARELANDYEKRTWREKAHVDQDDMAIIPANQFKSAISEAAKGLSLQIPGKGKKTYTKPIVAAVLVYGSLNLGVKKADLASEQIMCNANGRPGVGTRVPRIFPVIQNWSGSIEIRVLDALITEDILQEHLNYAGSYIGVGRWRPSVGGYNGRFEVKKIKLMKEQ